MNNSVMGGRVCMKIRRSKNKVLRVCIHKLPQYGAAKAANAEGVGESVRWHFPWKTRAPHFIISHLSTTILVTLCSETVKQRVFFSSCARAAWHIQTEKRAAARGLSIRTTRRLSSQRCKREISFLMCDGCTLSADDCQSPLVIASTLKNK